MTDISGVLGIYRHIIVARKKLPRGLVRRLGVDAFYDRLFDARFKITKWDNFARVYDNEPGVDSDEAPLLSLADISKLIDIRYAWDRAWNDEAHNDLDVETRAAMELIFGSRYGSYWLLVLVFEFCFGNKENFKQLRKEFVVQLSKLFIVYSALFGKAVNEMHSFLANLSRGMFAEDSAEWVIGEINAKLNPKRDAFERSLCGEIAGNMRVKYLLCRLSALLHGDFVSAENPELLKRVFHSELDIEHIKAYHDKNNNVRQDVWDEWKSEINAIGNLMVLERNMNRSIGNDDFSEKRPRYDSSDHNVVHDLLSRPLLKEGEWGKGDAIARRKDETEMIMTYVFSGLAPCS